MQAMLLVHNTAPFRLIRAAAPYMRDAAKQEIETSGKAAPRSIINVQADISFRVLCCWHTTDL
jgi:3-oxoacyl-[acyl-carrier protein] reductase